MGKRKKADPAAELLREPGKGMKKTAAYAVVGGGDPERVFADPAAARAYAAERTRACRPHRNPFGSGRNNLTGYGDLGVVITGGEKTLVAVVAGLGLTPPAKVPRGRGADWAAWWDRVYPDLTEGQRDAVWDALDKFVLYRVVKTTLEG